MNTKPITTEDARRISAALAPSYTPKPLFEPIPVPSRVVDMGNSEAIHKHFAWVQRTVDWSKLRG